ncbi:hypothetical protein CEUSTIGMA_g9144.t1 [Chlamydomonas eustigma]|uniref:acetate--CoA ligase n=1 Tax=Chlamydomonas eustigma TaxID=1157962 RepID=A0A250XFA8_9CHLO|nr:hypothetical protein CEUSTIGMA_g9144.t1 [Chlamydomonas eustigma]|eukprot:GAX81716.1 hypothetical protein CEUSTIGMA_g9144.t1 [Chlamydomonas eustigma]
MVKSDEKVYPPPDDVVSSAHIQGKEYSELYRQSIENPDVFWSLQANKLLTWNKKWRSDTAICAYNFDTSLGPINIRWFEGSELNLCYNAVDRHVEAGYGDRVAFYWEGNDVEQDGKMTYQELQNLVCQISNYLKSVGIKKGDDVTIYMPMIPELPAAMLACARIGAVHSVVFAGFSAESLASRIQDSKPRLVVTATGSKRGPKEIPLKPIVDEALDICSKQGHMVEKCLVYDHHQAVSKESVNFHSGRDVWWQDAVLTQSTSCPVERMDAEAPLFKLYTSGSTGKPKAVLHTTAGYAVGAAATFKYVFDYKPGDIYWCTADCGWITGHSYVTYGPLFSCASQVLFEGVPTWPDAGRCWQIVDKLKVTIFYTAPTAIRALNAKGDSYVTKYSRSSLRLLGSVGEPINPEAWRWYYEVVGNSRCPIMDTWWQTETGAHMITPLVGSTPLKPGSATLPFFGVEPCICDEKGNEIHGEGEGLLMIKRPWPSIMRTVAGNHDRFEKTYFGMFKGMYFTGDGCRRDSDGYYWIIGRVDDVINVSGHRIGTAEVESALVGHPACAEAAVVPVEHAIKGQAIYAFVTLMEGYSHPPQDPTLKEALIGAVRKAIGAIATPDFIHWAPGLPKTRSGKIMRRILRKIAGKEEESLGDISTLADPSVVETLIALRENS